MFAALGASGKAGRATVKTLRAEGLPVRAMPSLNICSRVRFLCGSSARAALQPVFEGRSSHFTPFFVQED